MSKPVRDARAIEALAAGQALLRPGRPVVVLLSGGRDSVCLLDLAVRLAGPADVAALHLNYGLRDSADADEALCRRLCERAGVPVTVERPDTAVSGNLQAWAREQRYALGAHLARPAAADVAAGHTRDDQVETVLYRLAASPGRRALLGMRARSAGLVRPLLGIRRVETAAYCAERGLEYADDPSNARLEFARNRVRHEVLPAWRELHPAADENLLRTVDVLRDEALVLDAVVQRALARVGAPPRVDRLSELEPAVARLALQALADTAAGGRAPAVGARVQELLDRGRRGGSASLDLGGGLRAELSYGVLRLVPATKPAARPPAPTRVSVPGATAFGAGVLSCERGSFPIGDGSLAAEALEPELEIRSWRAGDRMRPLGLGGTKLLQDIFTDAKVPRTLREQLPVVLSGGRIAWIPGVATGEDFRVRDGSREHVRLSWALADYD